MKRDRVGRWIPDRPIEHLFYWPTIAILLVGVYYIAGWISSFVPKGPNGLGATLIGMFGEVGASLIMVGIFFALILIYRLIPNK